jgi:hypothetical protein
VFSLALAVRVEQMAAGGSRLAGAIKSRPRGRVLEALAEHEADLATCSIVWPASERARLGKRGRMPSAADGRMCFGGLPACTPACYGLLMPSSSRAALLTVFCAVCGTARAEPVSFDVAMLPDFTMEVVASCGIAVQSAAAGQLLRNTYGLGLGIVGSGPDDTSIDGGEALAVRFVERNFDPTEALGSSYFVSRAGNENGTGEAGDAFVEAFDTLGNSLGGASVSGTGKQTVGELVGKVPVSSFQITSTEDSQTVGSFGRFSPPVALDLSFTFLPEFQTPKLELCRATLVGSNTLRIGPPNGLGVVGGLSDDTVDGFEFVTIDFGGLARDVTITSVGSDENMNGTEGDGFVEAFGIDGASLGAVSVTAVGEQSVSQLFGDALLCGFRFTANVDATSFLFISFLSEPEVKLLVAAPNGQEVEAFDGTTGVALGDFTSGGPTSKSPSGIAFGGPQGNLFVKHWSGEGTIEEYDGVTGAYIRTFPSGGVLEGGVGLALGPEGHLYAPDSTRGISRWDTTSGLSLGTFVAAGAGGLEWPTVARFGPDGNLYVGSLNFVSDVHEVLRFDGTTGAFIDVFVANGSGGLVGPRDHAFGPGGDLFVSSHPMGEVLRFDGMTGEFEQVFASSLTFPYGLAWGPGADLFVAEGGKGTVHRLDGGTGGSLGVFASGTNGAPTFLVFTPEPEGAALAGCAVALLALLRLRARRRLEAPLDVGPSFAKRMVLRRRSSRAGR